MSDVPLRGWYPDPSGTDGLRWWDGERWTDDMHAHPEDTSPPRRRRTRVIAVVALLLVIVLVSVTVLALGLARTRLTTREIEAQIAGTIANELGVGTTVTCPDQVDAGRELSFTCDVKLDNGSTARVQVTQKDDDGNVTWDVVREG